MVRLNYFRIRCQILLSARGFEYIGPATGCEYVGSVRWAEYTGSVRGFECTEELMIGVELIMIQY